jgi:hypothetical protein
LGPIINIISWIPRSQVGPSTNYRRRSKPPLAGSAIPIAPRPELTDALATKLQTKPAAKPATKSKPAAKPVADMLDDEIPDFDPPFDLPPAA